MVAGPVTGAEGDEQTGRALPDLRVWPEFGIPAQRAEETPARPGPGGGAEAAGPGGGLPAGQGRGSTTPPALDASGSNRSGSGSSGFDSFGRPSATAAEFGSVPAIESVPRQGTPAESATRQPTQGVPTESVPPQTMPVNSGEYFDTSALGAESAVSDSDLTPPQAPAEPVAGPAEPVDPAAQPRRRAARRSHRSSMRRQTSNAIMVLAALAVGFLVLHRFLPDVDGIGSLLETWLPWVGVPVLVLLLAAGIVHTRRAVAAALVAVLVWTALYGPTMLPRGSSAPAQLRVFSEDVNGKPGEATASGALALAQKADVVALEDLYSNVSDSSAVKALNAAYADHVTEYEFGLWSNYKITDVTPIMLGTTQSAASLSLGSDSTGLAASASDVPVIGALKATLATPQGALVVYLVHLPQPVLGNQGFAKARDQALTELVSRLKSDHSARLAVIGDMNVAATDRQFSQLTRNDGLSSAQQAAGSGFGFTWPAEFPIVRLDDVLSRGLTALRSSVLPSIAGGQTHLPIQVDFDY